MLPEKLENTTVDQDREMRHFNENCAAIGRILEDQDLKIDEQRGEIEILQNKINMVSDLMTDFERDFCDETDKGVVSEFAKEIYAAIK